VPRENGGDPFPWIYARPNSTRLWVGSGPPGNWTRCALTASGPRSRPKKPSLSTGGGIELSPGVVSRALAPAHIIAVASRSYLKGRPPPADPAGLAELDGIVMRSARTGRVRNWVVRNATGVEVPATITEKIVLNDPAAMCRAALTGLGVTLIAVPDALPHLESGALVRLVPR
jgi:DNA-binding transcriptional LysR family regulator